MGHLRLNMWYLILNIGQLIVDSCCQSIHASNQKTLNVWDGTIHARQIMKFSNTSISNWDRNTVTGWVFRTTTWHRKERRGMQRCRRQDITTRGRFWRRHHCQRHINTPQVGAIWNLTMCYMGVSYLTRRQFCWRSTWGRTFGFHIRNISRSNCEWNEVTRITYKRSSSSIRNRKCAIRERGVPGRQRRINRKNNN